MIKKQKYSGLVDQNNLDSVLRSTGYLIPKNQEELENFELLYDNFDSKLKDIVINITEITRGNVCQQGKIVSMTSPLSEDISELKMAARKGENSIPKEILDKMVRKHKNGDK